MKKAIGGILFAAVILIGCESMERDMKDLKSEFSGGLERTLKVYTETGELIAEYEGKFDIQYLEGKIKFIDEKKKVHIIYLGNSATAVVDEK